MAGRVRAESAPRPPGRQRACAGGTAIEEVDDPNNDEDPIIDGFHAQRTIPADDLLIWSRSAGKVDPSALLPSNGRPNPVVVRDLVICCLFSPGRLTALDRQTGKRQWGGRLRYLGWNSVYYAPESDLIYAGTSQELLALEPASGMLRWHFCPYGRTGETIYSSPTVDAGRLFVGDVRGRLNCLAADTGKRLWRAQTPPGKFDAVNSDPVAEDGVVVVATTTSWALGFEAATGRELWCQHLDGPCVHCRPGDNRTALLWTERSAYLFTVTDGQLQHRWTAPRGSRYHSACVAGELVLLVTDHGPESNYQLQAFRGGTEVYKRPYPQFSRPVLRHDPTTRRVYEATSKGLGILEPQTGTREAVIRFPRVEGCSPISEEVHPPFIEAGVLYVINGIGRVSALRHP